MGIHRFFPWFKDTMKDGIYSLKKNQNIDSIKLHDIDESIIGSDTINIDNFFIDANGIFHVSAQKIFKYGAYKEPKRLLRSSKYGIKKLSNNSIHNNDLKKLVYKDVCETIVKLVDVVGPKKRVFIAVDGIAPQAKQKQQRQRRFKSAMENANNDSPFDQNSITPGTLFMDHLTKYIDWYIKNKLNTDTKWKNLEIIFSNEKVPGEGESKLFNYIRKLNLRDESYCIHGLDSDLIMLCLATGLDKIYLLREDQFDDNNEFFLIDIGYAQNKLEDMMHWGVSDKKFKRNYMLNDFILISFLIGNDFLPQMPSIEVWNRGLDMMIFIYKEVCSSYGHLTKIKDGNVIIVKSSMKIFLATLGGFEKIMIEEKLNSGISYFKDEILEECSERKDENFEVDIDLYRGLYYTHKFSHNYSHSLEDSKENSHEDTPENSHENTQEIPSIENICHSYIEGMNWVLSYYTKGVPDWKWQYKYHYAPFAHHLSKHLKTYKFKPFVQNRPNLPFQQLLFVLPPKSAYLIPKPLNNLLLHDSSPIKKYYPEKFFVDISGKRKEYEGVVVLPIVDTNFINSIYEQYIDKVDIRDKKRNKEGKTFFYKYDSNFQPTTFESYYGNITDFKVNVSMISI